MKKVLFRPLAKQDLRDAVRYYRQEAGTEVAHKLVDVITAEQALLAQQPTIGSPRLGQELGNSALRAWRIKGFPMLIVYIERPDFVDVIRVLGQRQDVLAILGSLLDEEG